MGLDSLAQLHLQWGGNNEKGNTLSERSPCWTSIDPIPSQWVPRPSPSIQLDRCTHRAWPEIHERYYSGMGKRWTTTKGDNFNCVLELFLLFIYSLLCTLVSRQNYTQRSVLILVYRYLRTKIGQFWFTLNIPCNVKCIIQEFVIS